MSNFYISKLINFRLKKLTFLSKEEIEEYERKLKEHPELREAHKKLAEEIITDLHGRDEYLKAKRISESLFSDQIWNLTSSEIISSLKDLPTYTINKDELVLDLLVEKGICSSKREARELISNNAISINNKKITDLNYVLTKSDGIEEKVYLIKKGKKNYYLIVRD